MGSKRLWNLVDYFSKTAIASISTTASFGNFAT